MQTDSAKDAVTEKRSYITLSKALTALPLGTAFLYLLGVSFYQGYMRHFGLEETQFPLSLDRILFFGFFAILDQSAPQIVYFVLSSLVFALLAMAIVYLSTSPKIRRWISSLSLFFSRLARSKVEGVHSEATSFTMKLLDFSANLVVIAGLVFIGFLGVVLAVALADQSGQAAAKSFIEKAVRGRRAPIQLYLAENNVIKGHQIICSPIHCAFLVEGETVVYRHDQVEKIIGLPASKSAGNHQN